MPNISAVEGDRAANARNAGATRERILDAALHEFAKRGYAGARVKRIAESAGVNVQLLYRYFESKQGLHRAVQRSILEQRAHALDDPGFSLADALVRFHRGLAIDSSRIRFVLWEALQGGDTPKISELAHGEDRQRALQHRVERLRGVQAEGQFPRNLPADLLYLAIAGLAAYPIVFPQVTLMVTGLEATSDEFHAAYESFLTELGGIIDRASRAETAAVRVEDGQ